MRVCEGALHSTCACRGWGSISGVLLCCSLPYLMRSTKESLLPGDLYYVYCLGEGPKKSWNFLSPSRRGCNWEEMSSTQRDQVRVEVSQGTQ